MSLRKVAFTSSNFCHLFDHYVTFEGKKRKSNENIKAAT